MNYIKNELILKMYLKNYQSLRFNFFLIVKNNIHIKSIYNFRHKYMKCLYFVIYKKNPSFVNYNAYSKSNVRDCHFLDK